MLAFVGCLNRETPYFGASRGRGIAVLSFDPATGALSPVSETAGVDNPSFLVVAPGGRTLYATSEVYGWHEGVVTAYRIGDDGGLAYVNKQPTRGSVAAQVVLDPSGRWLLVVNYRMGADGVRPAQAVTVFPVEPDGGIGPAAHSAAHSGSGPDPDRQEAPHPHCALPSPDGRHVLVADLGIDRLISYGFDTASGALTRGTEAVLPPGTGPRHIAWASPGLGVVSGELANTITSFAWEDGAPRLLATASTLPGGFSATSHAADIHVSPDGRFVYASNRGHDSLVVMSLDADGRLAPLQHCRTAATPRHFTFDPSGRFVLVACQDGHEVTVFRRDEASGVLSEPVASAAVGSPMCVRFAP